MYKDLFVKGLIFVTGAAIGSAVTWKLLKTKYEQIANEEIDSMREYYSEKKDAWKPGENENTSFDENEESDDELERLQEIALESGYTNEEIQKTKENDEEDEEETMDRPYVIAPEETWEQDYPMLTLTYYEGDQILADDHGKIISNIDELVGEDFAEHFGEYEDDSVYVRNDEMRVYYEILRDLGCYTERDE